MINKILIFMTIIFINAVSYPDLATAQEAVDTSDIYNLLKQNEARAVLKYPRERIRITSIVEDINLDGTGLLEVVSLELDMAVAEGLSIEDAASINVGDSVDLTCERWDEVLGTPYFYSCRITEKVLARENAERERREAREREKRDREERIAECVERLTIVPPRYPLEALRRGIEGYVVVEFTVTAQGTTRDIVVVESSSSRGIFDEAAIESAQKFKYNNHCMENVPGLQHRWTWNLD